MAVATKIGKRHLRSARVPLAFALTISRSLLVAVFAPPANVPLAVLTAFFAPGEKVFVGKCGKEHCAHNGCPVEFLICLAR